MSTYLTPHFSLEELTRSDTATRKGIANQPPPELMANVQILAEGLERVRSVLGNVSVLVNSGYRCPELNAEIGGSKTSAHMSGLAADFICPSFGDPLEVCKAIEAAEDVIRFDQLIFEGDWVHVAFPASDVDARGETLTAVFGPSGTTYTEGIA